MVVMIDGDDGDDDGDSDKDGDHDRDGDSDVDGANITLFRWRLGLCMRTEPIQSLGPRLR